MKQKIIYNGKPKNLGVLNIQCDEMMFYQYLPIKLEGDSDNIAEKRLHCFTARCSVPAIC